jgi:hypothetical protein
MKQNYCTLFDINYLPHVSSLFDSLDKYIDSYTVYCFCMDDESLQFIKKNKNKSIIPISFKQLEIYYPELKAAKLNRSLVEYYFTCSSAICSFVFKNYSDIELLTYLDADLYFFSSPEPIFKELKDYSIGIISHKFNFLGKLLYEKYGKYNVGWISFRNDQSGRKCLEDWRIDCLSWCYDRLENGQFADQKYLNYWPKMYSGVHTIRHIGANLAPWNVGRYNVNLNSKTKQVMVNNQNLIFYHFASLKQLDTNHYRTNISSYFTYLSNKLKLFIYIPYILNLRKCNKEIGVNFVVSGRVDYLHKGFIKKIKQLSLRLRWFIFRDRIKINFKPSKNT